MASVKIAGIARSALIFGIICLILIMQMDAEPGWAPWDICAQSRQLPLKQDYKGLDALAAALKARRFSKPPVWFSLIFKQNSRHRPRHHPRWQAAAQPRQRASR
jgi:hypothetical protein